MNRSGVKQRVAIFKCVEYDPEMVEQGVRAVFEHFGGIERFVKPGQRVLIKPNLLAPDPPRKLTCTHPLVVEALIRLVQQAGGIAFVGDSPTLGSVHWAARMSGIGAVCQKYGVEVVGFGKNIRHRTVREGKYGFLYTARVVQDFDVILNVAKLKAHAQVMLTLGVKNMFGFVSLARRVRKHYGANGDLAAFARMLVKVYQLVNPSFTLVDGIVAMERAGPRGGTPKNLGLLFGGENAIAVDRVITEVLGLSYTDLPTLKAARELGAVGWDISRIEVCGETLDAVRVPDFQFPELMPISFEIYRSIKILLRDIYTGVVNRLGLKKDEKE
jgi:uncharacterized protein (DUF362 family)